MSSLSSSPSTSQAAWRPSPPMPSLAPRAIHVWRLRIAEGAAVGATLESHLIAPERERAARFRQPIDRLRFTRGRGLVRELLGYYLGQPPATVLLRTGPSGKPELDNGVRDADPPPLRFNVSHAGEWALVALSRDREVGVDVEHQRPMRDLMELAQRFFARVESAALERLEPAAREAAFFRIWSRKESFVKATGHGIAHGLDRFSVSHEDGPHVRLAIADAPEQANRWTITALEVADGYAAAVAFEGPTSPIATWEWTA